MGRELRERDVEMFIAVVEKPQDAEKYDILYVLCLGDLQLHVS